MFIPVIHKPSSRTYRKVIRKEVDIFGADCKVCTKITFPAATIVRAGREGFFTDSVTIFDPIFCAERKEQATYGFVVNVELNKDEYESYGYNLRRLEECACKKAKMQSDYQDLMLQCLEKDAGRDDYIVETFMPWDDPKAIKLKKIVHEYEEYVPV